MLRRNQIPLNQLPKLLTAVEQFNAESLLNFPNDKFVSSTLRNINFGLQNPYLHDIWTNEDLSLYCLCKLEIDADNEAVYTAYQLWIDPKNRSLQTVKQFIKFLRFYAQKQKFKRLNVITSRLDAIKAYQRGLGKTFKPKYVIFSEDM